MIGWNEKRAIERARLGGALLQALLFAGLSPSVAYSAEVLRLPTDVAEALAQNALDLDPLSITWTRTRSSSLSPKELLTRLKCDRSWGFYSPCTVVFKWQNGCAYFSKSSKCVPVRPQGGSSKKHRYAYEDNLELAVGIDERSFDGQCYYTANGAERDAYHRSGLLVRPLEKVLSENGRLGYPEYLKFAGFTFPYTGSEVRRPQLSSILHLLSQGGSVVRMQDTVAGGRNSLLVNLVGKGQWTRETHEFSCRLLPEYRYAVEHWEERTSHGEVVQTVANEDFMKVPGKGVYLPKRSTVRYHTWITVPKDLSHDPLVEEVFAVIQVDTGPIEEQQFSLREKYRQPGTQVTDHTSPGPEGKGWVEYRVPADPADLDRVIEAAKSGDSYQPAKRSRATLVWVGGGFVLALLAFLTRRKLRRTH